MTERRLLPYLSASAIRTLDPFADKIKDVPPGIRSEVAGRARVSQNTVDRFLKAETFPRSGDLDKMVTAVADVAGVSWLDPWRMAIAEAERAQRELSRDLGPREDVADESPADAAIRVRNQAKRRDPRARGRKKRASGDP